MPKITLAVMVAVVAYIIVATWMGLSFMAGGSGVLFIIGIGYSYVVAQRERALISEALHEKDYPGYDAGGPAAMPREQREMKARAI